MDPNILAELAATGMLRVGLNMANGLLITGTAPDGEPDGVAPDMAHAIAERLGVPVSLVQFASPGEIADSAGDNVWDIGLIGAEPARAEVMDFTAAYVEIEATYLVPEGSSFQTVEDVDSTGTRIAISGRSAYDLYLTRALKNAELVRSQGISGAVEIFTNDNLDALAGLRPALVKEAEKLPGTRILDDKFTAVQQAIGVQKGKTAAAQFVSDFVEEAKASGLVANLIEHHNVVGRLSVAAAGE
jgi:polar amino acid transport system substrate-binding protein